MKKGGEIAKILEEKFGDKTGVEEWPNQKHGWVMRANPDSPDTIKDIERSFILTKLYFDKF